MALPKIQHPIHTIELPLSKQTVRFRPFLVKEEKLLLMALQSDEKLDMMNAMKQVVNNCALDPIDVDDLPMIDVALFFLRLRAVSINNIIKVVYKDNEDEKNYTFEIDLNDVKVVEPETKVDPVIPVTDTISIRMTYPRGDISKRVNVREGVTLAEIEYDIMKACVAEVIESGVVHKTKDSTPEELEQFVSELPAPVFEKMGEFFRTQPKLYHEISYKNSLGHDRKIVMEQIEDFFDLA